MSSTYFYPYCNHAIKNSSGLTQHVNKCKVQLGQKHCQYPRQYIYNKWDCATMSENNVLLKSSHLDYYAFTQPIFDNSIKSGTVYKTHLPEQKKNIADNKKLYEGLRLTFGAKLLSSSGFVKMENY